MLNRNFDITPPKLDKLGKKLAKFLKEDDLVRMGLKDRISEKMQDAFDRFSMEYDGLEKDAFMFVVSEGSKALIDSFIDAYSAQKNCC